MNTNKHRIFIIAGEPSGDVIGGKLIKALSQMNPNLEFRGVGGDNMINEGLNNIFPMHDLSIMGFLEVIPAIPRIINRLKQTIRSIIEFKPQIIITIDSPGFNFRIVNKVRLLFGNKIKIIHYVAPSVWAYKPERVFKVAKLFDHLLMILPIEKQYFENHVPCTYVGHPIIEQDLKSSLPISAIRKKYGIKDTEKLITIMPGSRKGEIEKHLECFIKAVDLVKQDVNAKVFIPTHRNFEKLISYKAKGVIISSNPDAKKELITASDVALVKSGTSSVEMISYNIPTVVGYRMNALTYLYLKNKIKVKYASLINIILNREVIPEFIQKNCTPQNLADAILKLLKDNSARAKQLDAFQEVSSKFKGEADKLPSQLAAEVVSRFIYS